MSDGFLKMPISAFCFFPPALQHKGKYASRRAIGCFKIVYGTSGNARSALGTVVPMDFSAAGAKTHAPAIRVVGDTHALIPAFLQNHRPEGIGMSSS
jgi:hypothetical protein